MESHPAAGPTEGGTRAACWLARVLLTPSILGVIRQTVSLDDGREWWEARLLSFRDHEQLFAATCCHRAVDTTFAITLILPFGSRPSPRSGTKTRRYLIFAMKNSKEVDASVVTGVIRHPNPATPRISVIKLLYGYCLLPAEEGLEQDAASHCNQPN
jgi:hypothetical protein